MGSNPTTSIQIIKHNEYGAAARCIKTPHKARDTIPYKRVRAEWLQNRKRLNHLFPVIKYLTLDGVTQLDRVVNF